MNETLEKNSASPFIKWAGGKRQLLNRIREKYPIELGRNIDKYCEPFVGGGAILFDVLSNYSLREILINDINEELINTYKQLKTNVETLITELEKLQVLFLPSTPKSREQIYYDMRDRYNFLKTNGTAVNSLERASLFIFLNKTCFNGLYRVNRKGLYNVPMGKYEKPQICNKTNLVAISLLLKNVTINCGDYKECIDFIDDKTFVYIDPPYRPLSKTASFTAYNQDSFGDEEQIALRDFINIAHKKGAKTVLSNSDPKNTDIDDNFFDKLYSKYTITRISAKRFINSIADNRGNVSELLISN